MATTPTITPTPDGTVKFTLTVTQAHLDTAYQKVLLKFAKTAEVKGFRKGKAPLNLVEAQSDRSQLLSHSLEHALPPLYSQIITENHLTPLLEPRITPITMAEGKDWTFAVETAVAPDVKLGTYRKYVKADVAKHNQAHPHDDKAKPEDAKNHTLGIIFDSLLKHAELTLSPLLVEAEAKSALSRLVNQLSSLKLKVEDYAKSLKKTTDELVAEYQKTAETNLRLEFILQAVVKDIQPQVKESDPYKKYAAEKRAALDFLAEL